MKYLYLLGLFLFFGCSVQKEYYCGELIQQMNGLWCEDAALVGYTSAYLGHDEWKKLTDSFAKAQQTSPYGPICRQWNGHFYGRVVWETKGNGTE